MRLCFCIAVLAAVPFTGVEFRVEADGIPESAYASPQSDDSWADDGASTLESLRAAVRTQILAGEWSAAKDQIKVFKKLGGAEVSKEAKAMLNWIKGRKALVSLRERCEKRKLAPRAAVQKIGQLELKHKNTPELLREILDYRRELLKLVHNDQ